MGWRSGLDILWAYSPGGRIIIIIIIIIGAHMISTEGLTS